MSRTFSAKEKEGAATASANANSTKQSATTPASTSSGTSSAALSDVLPRISDPSPLPPTNSHPSADAPMGKSAKSSTQAAVDAAKDGSSTAANPYGTRSRNRNGTSRPNYAEDRDLYADIFELIPDRREGSETKKGSKQAQSSASAPTTQAATPSSSSPTNGATQPASRSAVNGTSASTTVTPTSTSTSRKPLPTIDDARKGHSSHGAKDQQSRQPSTSPAANGAATTTTTTNGPTKSKKRKVDPSANTSNSQTPTGAANSSASHNKRAKTNSHDNNGNSKTSTNGPVTDLLGTANGYGETNLLTFENTKAMPKNGKMVADDGTVLEVNGKFQLLNFRGLAPDSLWGK